MKILPFFLATASASLVCTPSVFADTSPLDQIIVTGARAPISAGDVGSAVTILTHEDIAHRQARYVSDLLRAVPGFAVSHSGVIGSQTQVRVRGSEANQVLVLIDGVRANDPATGDEFRWEYLATANIERIEIVRGPQSALWGSDAIGGVVHIITRTGSDARGFSGYAEGGTNNTANGSLNGGFGGDNWSVGLGFEQLTTDGSNISRSGDEKDDSDMSTASLNARLQVSDTVAVRMGLRSVDAYSQFDAVDFFTTGLPTDSDVATDSTQNFANLGLALGSFDSRVRHHLNVRHFDSDHRDHTNGSQVSSSAADRLSLSYQADIALGDNLLSVAFEREETNFEQRGAVGFGDPNQDQEMDTTSAVADFQGHAFDDLTYLLSLRFDDNSDFEDVLTGRASLAWNVSERTTLRANIGTGQKTPTFIERFGFFPGQFIGNPDLKPERSTSYDIGIDQRIVDSVSIQVGLFRQDIEDEIDGFVFDPISFLFTADNLSTTSKRSGVELAARWDVTGDFDLNLNYTYTDASEDGALELRRPRHSGSIQAGLSFLESRGRIALAADYGGTRHDVFFPPWPNPSEVVTLENYWLLDLTAQYQVTDNVKVFARGNNLLDTEYEQVYGYRTPGRAAYAGVQVSFGN
ncbi:MAG: TonB-dependent receptor [Gammaproteobacteria bacterium]|nr:TonB-dependent receptor [Gammaproteobacteria bacterium]